MDKPILRIPNLCIHLQRDMNKSFGPNPETQMYVVYVLMYYTLYIRMYICTCVFDMYSDYSLIRHNSFLKNTGDASLIVDSCWYLEIVATNTVVD